MLMSFRFKLYDKGLFPSAVGDEESMESSEAWTQSCEKERAWRGTAVTPYCVGCGLRTAHSLRQARPTRQESAHARRNGLHCSIFLNAVSATQVTFEGSQEQIGIRFGAGGRARGARGGGGGLRTMGGLT